MVKCHTSVYSVFHKVDNWRFIKIMIIYHADDVVHEDDIDDLDNVDKVTSVKKAFIVIKKKRKS